MTLKNFSDQSVRAPAGEGNPAAGPQYPEHLVGGPLLVRHEHHADRARDHLERLVVERQGRGVGLDRLEFNQLCRGAHPRLREQLGDDVGGGDAGVATCGRKGGVARAARHVEHPLAGAQVHPSTITSDMCSSREPRAGSPPSTRRARLGEGALAPTCSRAA